MPNPPTFRKVNPADQPILNLSLNSPTLPLSVVDEYAETMISQRISMITGVAQVNVMGAQKYAVRAQMDPNLLAARGIGIDEVRDALAQAQRQPSHRHALGPAPGLHRAGHRTTDERRGITPADRRLPQRRARCAWANSAA